LPREAPGLVEERAQGRVVVAALEPLACLLDFPRQTRVVHRRPVGRLEDAAHGGGETQLVQVEDGQRDELDPPLLAPVGLEGVAGLLLNEVRVAALHADDGPAMLDARDF
jgi:hypothetical protein